ncbi:unnamed protein product [Porites lobata]|uniref:Uncharacterized protein n=1 Tax=Porites lobata TaxID=104759 RepID=A0ABN8N846_9CNID|nr:unnamed protein product [Porites lobata]
MGTVLEDSTSYTITTVPGGEPLGMENGTIPDENITASSSASAAPPHLGRLNGSASWCTGKADGCYLQVDLGSLHLLCAVATQGNPGGNRDYVKRYKLLYSTDSSNWTTYEENGNNIIAGNKDNASVQRKDLEQELIIRYVRFCPVDWYCWPCMRVELYGAPLNIGEKIGHLGSDEGGGFVIDKVMVTTYETQVDENGETGLNEEANASKKTTEEEGHDYMVHIYTGNKWGSGTDANVMITIFGKEGDSGEKKLDNEKNNFETGQKDSFPVNCTASLGRLTKIRIGHDNTGFGAAWFLDKVIVEDLKSGETVEFPCQRWFSTNDDDGQITRELTRADENDAEMTDHDYLVHIYTGDKWGAGTDANVMITIFGEDGDSGERKLDNNKNNFETGQKDSFTLTCATSLGRLTKVRIGHDNTGFGAAWFLDKVAVEDPKTAETVEFPCQRWFSTRDDDGQITRELIRADVLVVDDEKTSPVTGHDYIAHIYTGDKWGAGTDANVMITIFGEEGDSGERRLDNDSNNFENGQKDSFPVSCATSLGRLTKIRIGHDNTGFGAAWFLDKVVIEDSKTGETVEFPCQRWFATSEDDGKIIRDLIRPEEEVKNDDKTAVPGQQTVVLKIKDVGQVEPQPDEDGSSGKEQENVPTDITDEKEEVVVKTDEIQIKPPPEQEEPTVTELENLPQEIVIDKEEVLVKTDEIKIESPPEKEEPTVKEEENLTPVIIINKEEVVVKTDEIQIEAPPEKEEQTAVKEEENLPQENIIDKGHDYLVNIYTGDKWGAGTDANVMITIFGEDGDSGERKLDNNKNNFETGQKDSFTLSCATHLGRINKIRIGHDNTGFGAAWFLDKVTVEDPKTGDTVEFSCQRWFSTSEDDGQITRELTRTEKVLEPTEEAQVEMQPDKDEPSEEAQESIPEEVTTEKEVILVIKDETQVEPPPEQEEPTVKEQEHLPQEIIVDKGHDYLVHIYTGDKWGAGTDANVLITIFGEDGDSGERKLDNNKNNFETGQKDSFTLTCATHLGRLNKIRIGHDNTGFGAAWFLDKVTVEDPKTGETVEFPCQRWFSTSEDDGQITRELTIADVSVPADATHVDENEEPEQDEYSLKEQEKKIIREAKERQRKEEEQENRLEEIQIIIEQEEGKRRSSKDDMDKERMEAEARVKLVLDEERVMQQREKPDGEDQTEHRERPEEEQERIESPEYSRIEEEHRRRMDAISAILEEDEKRRREEKEQKRMEEENARRKKEEERRKRDEELRKKREEERLKWEEEHKKWEEERKRRDRELEAVLEEGRRKRAEDRRKREEELMKNREEERKKREEERKKRMEEEMRKLEELKREREERWNKRVNVVVTNVDLSTLENDKENNAKNRQEEKKKKEEGWIKAVETPRKIEEDLKKFKDEERKRLEEERKKLQESEHAQEEAEREFKSELRVKRREEPETVTRISRTTITLAPNREAAIEEEKRRLQWRMQKIEQDRLLREEEERKRKEEVEKKRREEEERLRQEEDKRQKQEEEERQKYLEEMRLKREAGERQKQEEADRKRQEEERRRRLSLEGKRQRMEEDRKKREEEEQIWRRTMEEKKKKEEEERQKEIESKKKKRLSIDRKRFEEDEKKRLDAIERKRIEEEERARLEEEQRRREERERWKLKQAERRRSGDIYRRQSEEDLRSREDRASFKERQRKKRDSKSFETKWMFINGERNEIPDDDSVRSSVSDTSYSEPNVFIKTSPEPIVRKEEKSPYPDEKDSSQISQTTRIISVSTTITRTRHQDSRDRLHRCESEPSFVKEVSIPYRSQPRCDHLLPADPAVQMAEEMSFFDKYQENEGKLRPFPSWYGSLDMGSLPHLYSPTNPITDEDIDKLLAIEAEDFEKWKRVKKSRELEIYSRKGTGRGSPPVYKAIMILKDVPYRDAIDLLSDWDERGKWDKTFDGVSFLDQMGDFKVLKCSHNKKNRCLVLASLDREDEEPYYAWAWKSANHPSVPGEDTKLTVMRLDTGICGAIIRPYHDATQSSKITLITQVRGSIPSSLKSTYLIGNPSKWLIWLKKHHDSQVNKTAEQNKENDDSSSV